MYALNQARPLSTFGLLAPQRDRETLATREQPVLEKGLPAWSVDGGREIRPYLHQALDNVRQLGTITWGTLAPAPDQQIRTATAPNANDNEQAAKLRADYLAAYDSLMKRKDEMQKIVGQYGPGQFTVPGPNGDIKYNITVDGDRSAVEATYPDGRVETFDMVNSTSPGASKLTVTERLPDGSATESELNETHLAIVQKDAAGAVTSNTEYFVDDAGNPHRVTTGQGPLDQVEATALPDGSLVQRTLTGYDAHGLPEYTSETIPGLGHQSSLRLDNLNEVVGEEAA